MTCPLQRTAIVISWILTWTAPAFSQSPTWRALPNAPLTQSRMDDVFFINASVGWVISNAYCDVTCDGYTGVWKTTDGGKSWELKFTADQYLRSVGFADSLLGWVGTVFDPDSVLYQTTDGGDSWALVEKIPEPRPLGVCGISVVNDSVMYASGRFYGPPRVAKTTDRGNSWTTMDLSAYAGALVDCYFLSEDSGFVVGSTNGQYEIGLPRVLFTSDGGSSWSIRYAGTRVGELCWKIQFRDRMAGYVSIEGFSSGPTYYLKTTDGGVTWSDQLFLATFYDVQGIGFASDSLGWLGGWGGDTYETDNGGASWHLAGFGIYLNRFRFLQSGPAYAVGQTVFKHSVDSVAAVWQRQSSGTTEALSSVFYIDADVGTAVGDQGTSLRTTDGGMTWERQVSGTTAYLRSVYFTGADVGTSVGDGGTILRTNDGGSNWTSQVSGTGSDLNAVVFTSASVGTSVGDGGTILRTTNGGLLWTSQTSGTIQPLYAVSFTDLNTGTIVGGNGTILRTSDGGTNWLPQNSGTVQALRSVSFTRADTGTAVGLGGTMLRTTNGGALWTAQSSLVTDELLGVCFSDADLGLAVGRFGIILQTTDGGANWRAYSTGTSVLLQGVHCSGALTTTAVGLSGTILRSSEACPVLLPGDANANGVVTSADVIYLVNHVFKSGPAPLPVPESGDVNCDLVLTSSDIINLVNYVFKSGQEPCDICAVL